MLIQNSTRLILAKLAKDLVLVTTQPKSRDIKLPLKLRKKCSAGQMGTLTGGSLSFPISLAQIPEQLTK